MAKLFICYKILYLQSNEQHVSYVIYMWRIEVNIMSCNFSICIYRKQKYEGTIKDEVLLMVHGFSKWMFTELILMRSTLMGIYVPVHEM